MESQVGLVFNRSPSYTIHFMCIYTSLWFVLCYYPFPAISFMLVFRGWRLFWHATPPEFGQTFICVISKLPFLLRGIWPAHSGRYTLDVHRVVCIQRRSNRNIKSSRRERMVGTPPPIRPSTFILRSTHRKSKIYSETYRRKWTGWMHEYRVFYRVI